MITLRQLRSFVAVAEELHFGRAAERLHTSQPPVSSAIKQLEHELGVELLTRTTRSVRLTPAGDAFLAHARSILDALARSRGVARAAAGGELGRLRIGVTGVTAVRLFSQQARDFRRKHAGLDLDVTPFAYSGEQEEALLSGSIDVGFLMHAAPQRELATQQVWGEPLVVVMPETHALAERQSIALAELRDENFITFPPDQGSELRSILLAACESEGFRPRIARETSPPYMLLAFVGAGEGITVLPLSTTTPPVEGTVVRGIRGLETGARTYMTWCEGNRSPALNNFLHHARDFHRMSD